MDPNEALDAINKMRWDNIRHGGSPERITMSQKTFNEIVSGIRELICIDAGDHPEYTICGMRIDIRNDIDPETLFIVW